MRSVLGSRMRRGHTLVEVMFAIGLSSLVMVVAAGWTLSLIGSARQGSDVAGFYTGTSIVRQQLATDVGSARACDTTTPAVVRADATTLQLFITANGQPRLVTWVLGGDGVLTRRVDTVSNCDIPAAAAGAGVKLATGMSAPSGSAFGAYWKGQPVTVTANTSPENRIVDAIRVNLASDSAELGVEIPVEVTAPVNNYGLAIARG